MAKQPIANCYLGYGDGTWLNTEQTYEDIDQIVVDNPTLFRTITILDGGTAASGEAKKASTRTRRTLRAIHTQVHSRT